MNSLLWNTSPTPGSRQKRQPRKSILNWAFLPSIRQWQRVLVYRDRGQFPRLEIYRNFGATVTNTLAVKYVSQQTKWRRQGKFDPIVIYANTIALTCFLHHKSTVPMFYRSFWVLILLPRPSGTKNRPTADSRIISS